MAADADYGPYDAAYQGAPGSFSEEAARRWLGPDARLLPCRDLPDVIDALNAGTARYAIVPTFNSTAGQVPGAAALLDRANVRVVAEQQLPVVQALIGPRGASLASIEEVRSHPVALDQCRRFLAVHPRLRPQPWFDTAGAVRDVIAEGRREVAAIAGAEAAREYGGVILKFGIQDRPDNVTTFQVVELLTHPTAGDTMRLPAEGMEVPWIRSRSTGFDSNCPSGRRTASTSSRPPPSSG